MKNTIPNQFTWQFGKILLITLGFMLMFSLFTIAQTKVKLVGNTLVSVTQSDTAAHVYCLTCGSIKTSYTFTTKDGDILPVWKSKNSKFFVIRVSKKTGTEYKQYLITE